PVWRWRLVIDRSWLSTWTRRAGRSRRRRARTNRARGRSLPAWALACALLALPGADVVGRTGQLAFAAPPAPDVNQAKANMLWNIAKFVEWPGLPEDKSSPLVFTILGEDELAAELAGLLSSRTVNGRPVFVRFARRPQDAKGSQILYLAATESQLVSSALAAVDSSAVLTVSDAPGFAAHGGMVGFATEGEHVRFEVNRAQAERGGLKLSAKLLSLAHLVSDAPVAP